MPIAYSRGRNFVLCLAILGIVSLFPGVVRADGNETLNPTPIANGTRIVGEGIGLRIEPNPIVLNVPLGATIVQTYLYWNGFSHNPAGDDTLTLDNGVDPAVLITGSLIGGSQTFFVVSGNPVMSTSFRADITALNLVKPGLNTLMISDLDFGPGVQEIPNGASVLVVIDEGGPLADLQLVDGQDLAFVNFAPTLDTTVPQTFTFTPSAVDRVANLTVIAGSVVGVTSTGGTLRPNLIQVTSDVGAPQGFVNMLGSTDGEEWDHVELVVDIAAGASQITVQLLSVGDGSGALPASLAWLAAALDLQLGEIGDFVYCDLNDNGTHEAGEPAIEGVTVNLLCTGPDGLFGTADDVSDSAVTDANGQYLFEGLPAGPCQVSVDPATAPTDKIPGQCPITVPVDLQPGQSFLDADFCFIGQTGEIGDEVYCDLNNNGVRDGGEPGIADVLVQLTCAGGDGVLGTADDVVATQLTNLGGGYLFTGVAPGACLVTVDAATVDTDKGPGQCPGSFAVDLAPGQSYLDADFCYVSCSPCDGKVTTLTLRYLGSVVDANITVQQKKDMDVIFNGVVQPNAEFSFVGTNNDTMGTEIWIQVDGGPITAIHTSCSKPIGPGLIFGDFEVVAGESLNGGPLCPLEPTPGSGCKPCDGKVTVLTLRYLGTLVDALITVEQKKDSEVIFADFVQPNGEFTFVGTDKKDTMGTEIWIQINGGPITAIHTSCSKPIGPGLIFGDFEVVAGESRNGGTMCPLEPNGGPGDPGCGECDGKVTTLTLEYAGVGGLVEVTQKKGGVVFSGFVADGDQISFVGTDKGTLGTQINITIDGAPHVSIHTSCSQPIGIGMVFGGFEVIAGASAKGGTLCPLDGPGNPPAGCGECDGKVTTLTLEYTGPGGLVEVAQKKNGVVFSGVVADGDLISFVGTDKKGTLGTEISITIDGVPHVAIHTSCSKPIGIGSVFGAFEVIAGASRNGGPFCP